MNAPEDRVDLIDSAKRTVGAFPTNGARPSDDAPQRVRRHGFGPRTEEHQPQSPFAPTGKFGRMFPQLRPLVPPEESLTALARAMLDTGLSQNTPEDPPGDNPEVPAGFTYLGQFIDHDLTLDITSLQEMLVDPLSLENFRTPMFDLDSVYGSGPVAQPYLYQREDPDLFLIGKTSQTPGRGDPTIPTEQPNDLPRAPHGFALIGDHRNDENLIVAQLHLAFLKFHNKVVVGIRDGSIQQESPLRKSPFEEARDLVIWHYQWIVLHDFLSRILDKSVLDDVLTNGRRFYKPEHVRTPFLPVEFSGAAYRLGHSMVREVYDYNRVFTFRPGGVTPATFSLLFRFSGLSGTGGNVPIPSDWIIDWRRFFSVGSGATVGLSRNIDPLIATQLHDVPNLPRPSSLPARNLLRGRSLGLPSGQSVAKLMRLRPLSPSDIAKGPDGEVAAQHQLHVESPLWYYILKEAQIQGQGKHLGQVGSRIVAEVFVGLLEADSSSFLAKRPGWKPTLPAQQAGTFTMADLLTFVGDLNPIGESSTPAPGPANT